MNQHPTRIGAIAACASLAFLLAACGGHSSPDTPQLPQQTPQQSAAQASSLTGTAAIGTALANAPIVVTDASGNTATATTGADGKYAVSLAGLTAPFVITASDRSGAGGTLYSVVATTRSPSGAPLVANVTPLTTAVAALLTTTGNPQDLKQAGGASQISATAVATAIATLDAALAPILADNGVSATFDPIGGAFSADQTGADAVIDSVSVTASAAGTGLQIASLADPSLAIQLHQGAAVSAVLQKVEQKANYLAPLVAQLTQCMSDTQAGTSPSTACAGATDANYLSQGVATLAQRHPALFSKGTTLTGVKTLAFLPSGTLPAITRPAALVYFLMTTADGTPNFASEIVQQLSDGSWDIIGNQQQYNSYIAGFQQRLQYVGGANAGASRYESGLSIQVPQSIKVNGATTFVGSARIQGSGLPTNGLYLEGSTGAGMTLPPTAANGPWTGGPTATWPSYSFTHLYKMDWTSGGAAPTTGDYATQQVDVSKVAPYSKYTVTYYDMSGNEIATESTVGVAPVRAAASAAVTDWQTLGDDVITRFLTPQGADTTASGSTVALDWTAPANATYPNFWTQVNTLGAPTPYPMSAPNYAAPTGKAGSWSEQFTAPAAFQWEPLAEESVRELQLGWQAGGVYYLNSYRYSSN